MSERGTQQLYGFGATVPAILSTLGLGRRKSTGVRSHARSRSRSDLRDNIAADTRRSRSSSLQEEDADAFFLGSEVFLVLTKWPFARLMLAVLREAAEQQGRSAEHAQKMSNLGQNRSWNSNAA